MSLEALIQAAQFLEQNGRKPTFLLDYSSDLKLETVWSFVFIVLSTLMP